MAVPTGIEYKVAGVLDGPADMTLAPVKPEGIVTAIVAVTGIKDDVDDVIVPGSAARTLAARKPKVCLGHDWNRPIGKTLDIKELLPGDPGLPKATPDGKPWPREAGAIVARALYNLATRDGQDAYEQAKFYGPEETYQSIGYRVPEGGATFKGGVRYIRDFDLLEYGPVLHPANRLAALQDVKAAQDDGLSSRSDSAILDSMIEEKARYVKDSTYWGLPIGTLIRPGMKPRGPAARRSTGEAASDNVGVVEIDTARYGARIKPTAKGKHQRDDGLFEQQVYDLFDLSRQTMNGRERPDPFDDNAFQVDDTEKINKGDSYNPLDMLVANAVPPIELEDALREADWDLDRPGDRDLIERETEQYVTDVMDAYRAKYNAELVRQNDGSTPKKPRARRKPKAEASAAEPEAPVSEEEDGGAPAFEQEAPPRPRKGKTTYSLTAPSGQRFYRQSARAYTHAVLGTDANGKQGAYSFNGSAASAAKSRAELSRRLTDHTFEVREVDADGDGKPDSPAVDPEAPQNADAVEASTPEEPTTNLSPLAQQIFDDVNAAPASAHIGNRLVDAAPDGPTGNAMRATATMLHPSQAKKKRIDPDRGAQRHARNYPENLSETADANDAIADVLEAMGHGDDGDKGDGFGGISEYLRARATALRKIIEADGGEPASGTSETEQSDPAPETPEPSPIDPKDMTTWPDERLDKEREKARKAAFMSLNGSAMQRGAQSRLQKIDAERARRADAARRTVPAHPLPPDEYRARMNSRLDRGQRMRDIQRRTEDAEKVNAAITSSEEVAASAPETIPELPGVVPVADGRIGLKNAGKASWQLVSGDGRTIAHMQFFVDPRNPGRAVRLNRGQAGSFATHLAAITNDQGDRIPFTSTDSAAWVPGFRDSSGRDAQQAVYAAAAAWAEENGFTPSRNIRESITSPPRGSRTGAPGVADEDGFYPGERAKDIGVGDEIRLPDGTTHVVAEKDVPDSSLSDRRYGGPPTLFKFNDGGEFSMTDHQRVDVRFADDPAAEDYLRDPGMGWTSAAIGSLPSELRPESRAVLRRAIPDPLASGTRVIYTPDRSGYLGEYADNRPRVGQVTDRFEPSGGVWFQVVEYDDGTFDALNVASLIESGKLTVDPSEDEQRKARQAWGLEAADEPTEPAPDLEEDADAPSDLDENESGTEPVAEPEPNIGLLATRATGDLGAIKNMTPEQLAAVDEEMTRRAILLGRPGQVSKWHQAVRDERARRDQEPAIEPEGETIATADLDEADAATDDSIGLTEGPDGELEAEPDVADRQDRVEALLTQADAGGLDLTAASDGEVSSQRRDLVDELRFQDAVASRESRKARAMNPVRPPAEEGENDGGASTAAPAVEDTGPKVRPGVAGAALDLADALEGDDDELRATAQARMDSLLRRSRSDSPAVAALRDAFAGGEDVTPEMLRAFADDVRAERRERANTQARARRLVKRLERERIRALIAEHDAELRRRNLDPDEFGGAVPADAPAAVDRGRDEDGPEELSIPA